MFVFELEGEADVLGNVTRGFSSGVAALVAGLWVECGRPADGEPGLGKFSGSCGDAEGSGVGVVSWDDTHSVRRTC